MCPRNLEKPVFPSITATHISPKSAKQKQQKTIFALEVNVSAVGSNRASPLNIEKVVEDDLERFRWQIVKLDEMIACDKGYEYMNPTLGASRELMLEMVRCRRHFKISSFFPFRNPRYLEEIPTKLIQCQKQWRPIKSQRQVENEEASAGRRQN